MQQCTADCETMTGKFLLNFKFESNDPSIDEELHKMKNKIFALGLRNAKIEVPLYTFHHIVKLQRSFQSVSSW